jgi:hypothetical protein
LVDPRHRVKEDGSYTSNQYNFQGTPQSVPSKKVATATQIQGTGSSVFSGSRPEPPEVVAPANPPSRPGRPEQSEGNKKKKTITEVDFMPTEKQKTCTHPHEFIVILPDEITICNHCYALLDENLKLREERITPEIVEAA